MEANHEKRSQLWNENRSTARYIIRTIRTREETMSFLNQQHKQKQQVSTYEVREIDREQN